jgi:hypothetical protein
LQPKGACDGADPVPTRIIFEAGRIGGMGRKRLIQNQ